MATFELPACDAGELKRRLYDDYKIEVPIIDRREVFQTRQESA